MINKEISKNRRIKSRKLKSYLFFLGRACYWLIINTMFGLFPLIIALLLKIIITDTKLPFEQISEGGLLLFFCVAISASVMTDYLFSSINLPKTLDFIFYFIPFGLALVASVIFSQLFFLKDLSDQTTNLLVVMQYIILLLTLMYCLTIKTIIFVRSKANPSSI